MGAAKLGKKMNITENRFAANLIITRTISQLKESLVGEVNHEECEKWGITAEQWVSQTKIALAEKKYTEGNND